MTPSSPLLSSAVGDNFVVWTVIGKMRKKKFRSGIPTGNDVIFSCLTTAVTSKQALIHSQAIITRPIPDNSCVHCRYFPWEFAKRLAVIEVLILELQRGFFRSANGSNRLFSDRKHSNCAFFHWNTSPLGLPINIRLCCVWKQKEKKISWISEFQPGNPYSSLCY